MKFRLIGRGSGKDEGSQNEAGVSSNGEVITRPFAYSDPSFKNLNVVNTAFNFFNPITGFQFVTTGALISGNRDIGVNGSILIVYTADTEAETTVLETILEAEVPKSSVFPFIVPNVITPTGRFINGKCDDNSVRVALYGYFVPNLS